MIKVFIFSIFVISVLCFVQSPLFAKEDPNLGSCNIAFQLFPPYKLNRKISKSASYSCEILDQKQDQKSAEIDKKHAQLRFLQRLDDNRFVAVVQLNAECASILNPVISDEIDYGPIPEIKEITANEAETLWGPHVSDSDGITTYQLALGYSSKAVTKNPYFIDVQFDGERLKKYRIRNQEISVSEWVTVQK